MTECILIQKFIIQKERSLHNLNRDNLANVRIRSLLNDWRLYFSENPPKGFEKYFKPGGASKAAKEAPKEAAKETPKEMPPKESPPRGPSEQDRKSDFEFKFGSSGKRYNYFLYISFFKMHITFVYECMLKFFYIIYIIKDLCCIFIIVYVIMFIFSC